MKYLSLLALAFPFYGYALPHNLRSGSIVFRDCTVIGRGHTSALEKYEVVDEKNRFLLISGSGLKYQSPLLIPAYGNHDLLERMGGDGYYSRLILEPYDEYIYSYKSRALMTQIICSTSTQENDDMVGFVF
ncbi:hypothetical protein [Klebsiella aerogenes]|uniref:hypothetical protein n=1 Tax=Klebsiella aerogenes TaxID=548 RepID=UPI003D0602FE